jgi:hydroxypyruvate isomerase
MLRFSANLTFLFRDRSLLERFSAARDAGFDGVELLSPEGVPVTDLAEAARQARVEVVLCNAPIGDFVEGGLGLSATPGLEKDFRRAIEQAAELATTLQCPMVHLGPSRVPVHLTWRECYAVYLKNVAFATRHLAERGITATIEPLNSIDTPNIFLSTLEQALRVIDHSGQESLKLQFDVYHIARSYGDYMAQLRRNIGRVAHIQIADVPGRGEPGSGALDFDRLFHWLDKSAYAGWVGAEYHPSTDTISSLDWFKNFRMARV